MALYRYFRPAHGVLDSKGPLLGTIAPSVLAEVNKEVKSVAGAQKKKRGSYLFFTPEEKARVAQYAGIHASMEFEPWSDDKRDTLAHKSR